MVRDSWFSVRSKEICSALDYSFYGHVIMLVQLAAPKFGQSRYLEFCTCAEAYSIMDDKSGEMCFYYFLNVMGCFMQKTKSHRKMYI